MSAIEGINPEVGPSGTGCVDCDPEQGWWLHLRRCAECGHVGCCDDSPSQHATKHYHAAGHPIMQSFEPGESWMWNYRTNDFTEGPALAPPVHHPVDQPVPGPAGHVPANWQQLLN
ncbi:UBP-type zinc finger domain-containing protein [Subtercola sp. YIM 133946]|uniref:UBP-type zinc finger domain-containing protein n=1 Tax=Subtercola sp. YIM 133946 TaxID=3118909 RepID=UPI002F946ED8